MPRLPDRKHPPLWSEEISLQHILKKYLIGCYVYDHLAPEVTRDQMYVLEFHGPSQFVKAGRQSAGFPQVRVVTLTECGTHAQVHAAVGGFNGGERELAIALAGSAAAMLVLMDRNFPGVALWMVYLDAGSHLLLRARSPVAHRPIEHLADGTYLARMNLAGQKGTHPGGVLVRVIEYRVDGGEVVRLLTDLLDPAACPAAELATLYRERWEAESAFRQIKTFQRGPAEVLRSGDPDLVRQEVWVHLAVHHCLTRVVRQLADGPRRPASTPTTRRPGATRPDAASATAPAPTPGRPWWTPTCGSRPSASPTGSPTGSATAASPPGPWTRSTASSTRRPAPGGPPRPWAW